MAEVLAVLGRSHVDALLPELLAACSSPMPFVREGNLTLFRFLPHSIPDVFQVQDLCVSTMHACTAAKTDVIVALIQDSCDSSYMAQAARQRCMEHVQDHLGEVLPAILDGLADESEGVRDAALQAGRTSVEMFAETSLPLLLPAVENGIIHDNWRIRQSSVELLGDLLFKVSLHAFPSPCSFLLPYGHYWSLRIHHPNIIP